MANENLGLKIIASLNMGASIGVINEDLRVLSKHPSLQKLSIKIDIDQSFIKSVSGFIEASKKLSSNFDTQNKVIKETVNEYKNLDGSITKTTQQILANGEQIEKSRTKHDENKKAIQDETKAYDAERKTLADLKEALKEYEKASTKVNKNNSLTHTYKNDETKQTVTVNTDANGYVINESKLTEHLKLQQSTLAREQEINKARELVAKEEYNIRKAIADKALREEEKRNKQFETTVRQRYEFEKNEAAKTEALDKAHYQALQQNKKRDQDYAQSVANTQQKISDAKSKFSGNTSAVASLTELETKLRSISNIGDFKSPLTNLNNELKRTIGQLNEGTGHARSFGDSLKNAFSNIVMYAGVGSVFAGVTQFFREGISYVNELNKSLTELSIVYMEGQEQVEGYAEKFHELGMEMGITTSEIAKGAVEFARQGLSQEETFSRMETTIKYAKISSLDFATAAKIVTASVNSMNVSAERASDVFSYLGDATATGADEVGQGMQRVGGTAGAVGVKFEKVASWIATMSANSREGAYTIGNSVKSILARMQSLKEQGFDEEDGTKVNDVAKALATIGVELVDAQGNFRDFGVVMDEIGGKWDSLTSRQQAYISTTVAGSWQSAKFLGLMSDYGQSVDLYKGALDSAGVSTEKFGLYQQGTEAHLNTMKTALEGLWSSMFKSDGIRSVIDMMTGLFTVLKKVTDTFGGLQTIVGTATIALLLFNRTLPAAALKLIGIDLRAVALSMQIFTGSTRAATLAVGGLQAAMSIGLVAGAALAITVISKLVTAHQKLKEEQQALKAQQKQIANSWSTQASSIRSLVGEYEQLNEATKGGTLFADIEQETKYKDLVEKLAELMPNLVSSIDEKGEKHLKNAAAIQEELKYAQQLTDLEQKQNVLDAGDTFKEKITEIKDYKDQILDLQTQMAMGGNIIGTAFVPFNESDLNKMQISMLTLQQKAATASSEIKESLNTVVASILSVNKVKIDENITKQISNITSGMKLEGLSEKDISDRASVIAKLATDLNALKDTTYAPLFKQTSDEIKLLGASIGLTDNQIDLLTESVMQSSNALSQNANALVTVADRTDDVNKITADLSDKFKEATDTVSPLNAAIQKLRQGKSLTADEITNLIEKVDGFSSAVTTENGVLKVNLKAVTTLRDQSVQSFNKMLKAKEAQVKDLEVQTDKELEKYGIQIDGIKSVAEAMQALAKKKDEVDRNMYTLRHDPESNDTAGKAYMKSLQEERQEYAATEKSILAIDEAKKKLNDLRGISTATLKSVGEATDEDTKSKDKNYESTSDTIEILTELQQKLKDIQKLQDAEENKRRRMRQSSKEYQDSLKKTIDLKKEELALLEKADPSQLVSTKVETTTKTSESSSTSSSTSANTKSGSSSVDTMLSNALGLAGQGKFKYEQVSGKYKGTYEEFVEGATSDCSQFVQEMFDEFLKINLPRTAAEQAKQGVAVSKADLKSGDLVFFKTTEKDNSHVGIYTGNGKMVQMGNSGLKESDINSSYWSKRYQGARRITDSSSVATAANSTGVGVTTTKDGNKTTKITGPTSNEISNAAEKKEQDEQKLKKEILDSQNEFLESIKRIANNAVEEQERLIAASQKRQEKLDPTSQEFIKENDYQTNRKTDIQKIKNKESLDLQAKLKEFKIESDEYDNLIKQLQTERSDIQSDKYKTLVDNLNIGIDVSKERIADLDNLIQQSQNAMSQFAEGTPEYNKELNTQIELTKKQRTENEKLILSLERIVKSKNLAPADKKDFQAILDSLKLEDYTSDIKDLSAELIASKGTPLTKELDELNHKLDVSKATLKGFREGTEEYNTELKKQISIIDELVVATNKMKDYAEIQSKNQELSASVREDYKKQVQELTMSLYDYADSLKSIREEYADKIIDNYKKMLEERQKLQKAAYEKEKELENERHEDRIKNLDEELSAFEDNINAQSKSFDRDVASEDYADQLAKLQKEKAELDAKFSTLLLDDSLEAKSKRADLEKEISAKSEEITKLQRDREITIRKDGLSDQLEDRKNAVDKEKKLEDDKNAAFIKNIENLEKINDDYYEGLINDEQYFYNMKQNLMSGDTARIQNELTIVQSAYTAFYAELEKNSKVYADKIASNLKYAMSVDEKYASNFPIGDTTIGSGTGSGTGSSNNPGSSGGNKDVSPVVGGKSEKQSAWEEYLSNKQKAEQLKIDMQNLLKDSAEYKNKQAEFLSLNSINEAYRKKYPDFPEGSYAQVKRKIFSAESGGMTPANMGPDGKFLLAHEKELVLNKFDTSRILETVNVVRDLTSNMSNINRIMPSNVLNKTSNTNPIVNKYEINIDRVIGTEKDAKLVATTINDVLTLKQKQGR